MRVRETCRCVPGSQESHGLCNVREQCELLDCDLIITVLYLCVFRLYRKAGVLRQENKVFHMKLFRDALSSMPVGSLSPAAGEVKIGLKSFEESRIASTKAPANL